MDQRVYKSAHSFQPASLIQGGFIKENPVPTFRAAPTASPDQTVSKAHCPIGLFSMPLCKVFRTILPKPFLVPLQTKDCTSLITKKIYPPCTQYLRVSKEEVQEECNYCFSLEWAITSNCTALSLPHYCHPHSSGHCSSLINNLSTCTMIFLSIPELTSISSCNIFMEGPANSFRYFIAHLQCPFSLLLTTTHSWSVSGPYHSQKWQQPFKLLIGHPTLQF